MPQDMPDSRTLSIALWAANYSAGYTAEDAWMACAKRQIHAAAAGGASILVMPEWLSEMWGLFGPDRGMETWKRTCWEAETAGSLLGELGEIARKQGIALLAGTAPALTKDRQGWTNRARLYLPDGQMIVQDKLFLTPSELLIPNCREADTVTVFDWDGYRVAMPICLDCESPVVSTMLRKAGVDLILVPSLTGDEAGYTRVCTGVKALAMQALCPVPTVGSIGLQPVFGEKPLLNISGAAVFMPAEKAHWSKGVLFDTGIIDNTSAPRDGVLSIVHGIQVDLCRQLRAEGADVWSSAHIFRTLRTDRLDIRNLLPRNDAPGQCARELS